MNDYVWSVSDTTIHGVVKERKKICGKARILFRAQTTRQQSDKHGGLCLIIDTAVC